MGRQRLAMLDPEFGSLYPDLEAGQWFPAMDAALQVTGRIWRERGAEVLARERVLPEEHFRFRGGLPRELGWYVTPERLGDPSPTGAGVSAGEG